MGKKPSHKILIVAVSICLLMVLSTDVFAFDKQRKGFILGFGLGPGFASYTETIDSTGGTNLFDESKSKFSALVDFKIGYAPSDKLMIYWMSKEAFFGKKDSTTFDESKTAATGIGGLGLTYFFKPQAPSLFISVGGGFSAWSLPFEGSDLRTGIGFGGGIGYEFSPNWNLEFGVLFGSPSENDEVLGLNYEYSTFAIGVTINALGY